MLVSALHALGGLLKAREHGALAAGEVLAGAAVLADLAHDVLHEAELVTGEGEGLHVVVRVGVADEVSRGALEGEEVLEHGGARGVLSAQHAVGVLVLGQDAALDDLVGAGA